MGSFSCHSTTNLVNWVFEVNYKHSFCVNKNILYFLVEQQSLNSDTMKQMSYKCSISVNVLFGCSIAQTKLPHISWCSVKPCFFRLAFWLNMTRKRTHTKIVRQTNQAMNHSHSHSHTHSGWYKKYVNRELSIYAHWIDKSSGRFPKPFGRI